MTANRLNWFFRLSSYAILPLLLSGHLEAKSLVRPSSPTARSTTTEDSDSCQPDGQPTGPNCFVENFTAPIVSSQPMDLLLVVQTSNSIANEMPAIKAGVTKFIDSLPANADFNIAVMLSHGSTSSWSGKLYQSRSEPIVLRTKELSKDQIKNYLNLKLTYPTQDPNAGGGEEGLFSLFNGISSSTLLSGSQAAGFFRPNAGLTTVFIADQRDICAVIPTGVPPETDPAKIDARIRDCEGLTAQGLSSRLKTLKGNQPLKVTGIIYSKAPVAADPENEIGYGITDMIQINGSTAIDIARDDIAQGLRSNVPGSGSSSAAEFTLSHSNVDPGTVSVKVNGQNVAFKIVGNKVTLTQAISSGATVVIQYCLGNGNLSSKAEKLAAIMTMSCPIYNASYPAGYASPSAADIARHLKACTPELYPETPTTAKQQTTLNRMLNPQDSSLRKKMFHRLWYSPDYSDHFEYYFGLEIKEAVQIFCLNNNYLSDILITSEYAKSMYDQTENWLHNPAEQKKWRFAQSLRKQLKSCLNR